MTTETHSHTGDHPDWHDPFSEPRAFPGRWDLAELPGYEPSPDPDRVLTIAAALLDAAWIERRPEPFPEPNDFPGGWNLSDVLALDRERMLAQNGRQELPSFLLPISFDAVAYATA
jgi:hypothetical protein